jgi:hypothetical protein
MGKDGHRPANPSRTEQAPNRWIERGQALSRSDRRKSPAGVASCAKGLATAGRGLLGTAVAVGVLALAASCSVSRTDELLSRSARSRHDVCAVRESHAACGAIALAGAMPACSAPAGDTATPSSAAQNGLALQAPEQGLSATTSPVAQTCSPCPLGRRRWKRHQPTWLDVNPDAGGGVERSLTETGDGDLLGKGSVLRTHFDSMNSVVKPFDIDLRFAGERPCFAERVGVEPAGVRAILRICRYFCELRGDPWEPGGVILRGHPAARDRSNFPSSTFARGTDALA